MGNGTRKNVDATSSNDDILSYVELKERGRITIPSKLRKDRGWKPNDHLVFVKRKCFLITPDKVDEIVNAVQNGNKEEARKQLKDAMNDRILIYKTTPAEIVDTLPPLKK